MELKHSESKQKRQQLLDFEAAEKGTCDQIHSDSLIDLQFASVKRVSLVYESSLLERPCLNSTDASKEFFKRYWRRHPANDQERFVVACLDTKHRVQCVVVITVGTLDASLVHPREVFKPAMIEGSSAVVLSHNHPSGNTEPSKEDRAVTDRLTEIGKLVGIEVLDHIIHGDGTGDVLSIREY
ncbi:MAG: JAB domain-containing protein [Planctomycetota bacterium]